MHRSSRLWAAHGAGRNNAYSVEAIGSFGGGFDIRRGVRAGDAADSELETEAEELFDINFEQIGEIEF